MFIRKMDLKMETSSTDELEARAIVLSDAWLSSWVRLHLLPDRRGYVENIILPYSWVSEMLKFTNRQTTP